MPALRRVIACSTPAGFYNRIENPPPSVPDTHRSFVFHDPSGKRWQRFRRGLQTCAIFFGILLVLFVLSMAINPQIPALGLPPVEHIPDLREVPAIIRGERPMRNVPFKLRKAAGNIKYVRSASPVLHPKTAARVQTNSPVVFGFYVNWDPGSMSRCACTSRTSRTWFRNG